MITGSRSVRGALAAALVYAAIVPGLAIAYVVSAQTDVPPHTVWEKIAASKDLLDINAATPAQLKALPGMGDAYVQRVIEGRPYTAKNQLATRGILPQAEYEKIKDQIIAHRPKK